MANQLFPALLKHWRHRSGLSQLDLAPAADVSTRHLSYLETGRARPSAAMVIRLMSCLSVPLRHQNDALVAAGFERRFDEQAVDDFPQPIRDALTRMLGQQEPFPMTVLSIDYRIVDSNDAAQRLFALLVKDPSRLTAGPLDMVAMLLDPELARPACCDWEHVARHLLSRLQREVLRTGDERLARLLDRALTYPGVKPAWRYPQDDARVDATLSIWLRHDSTRLGFLTTLTAFTAPGMVSLEEMRLESYFPLDDITRRICERLPGSPPAALAP